MKKSIVLLVIITVFSLFLVSCGGSKSISKTDAGDIPEWYLTTPEDPNYVFESASATSKDMELAVSKATTEARAKIARTLEIKVNSIQKKFEEEVGEGENSELLSQFTQATKTVVSTELKGSKITKKKIVKDGGNWRAYVLGEYPIGAAQQAFLNQISKNDKLYTRVQAGNAFKELENEVKKYEDSKQSK